MSDAFTSKTSVVIEVIVRLYGLGVEIYDETHRSFFLHEKEDKSPVRFPFIVKPENICTPVGRCGLQPGSPPVTGKGGSHPLLGRDAEFCVKVITESTITSLSVLHTNFDTNPLFVLLKGNPNFENG